MKGSIRQAIIQFYFIYKIRAYTVSRKVNHPTDGDNLVIAAVDLQPRMDKDEVRELTVAAQECLPPGANVCIAGPAIQISSAMSFRSA